MKQTVPMIFLCVLLFGCGSSGRQPDDGSIALIDSNRLKGVIIAHTADKYDAYRGQYTIIAMLKHTGHLRLKYLQLNAVYYDTDGKQLARSIGGPESELMPGDSAIVKTTWVFPTAADLPNKVVLTVSN
jgi:hypothetical protein